PEPAPSAAQQAGIAAAGPAVFVSVPSGHVVRLAGNTLRPQARLTDPLRPVGLTAGNGLLYVADGKTLTSYKPQNLTRVSSAAFPTPRRRAGGAGPRTLLVQTPGRRRGLCVLPGLKARRCVSLPFVPAGLGTAPGHIVAANRQAGTVTILSAETLAGTPPIAV